MMHKGMNAFNTDKVTSISHDKRVWMRSQWKCATNIGVHLQFLCTEEQWNIAQMLGPVVRKPAVKGIPLHSRLSGLL